MNTTRRYPRTAAEAFKDASYADAFEPPAPKQRTRDIVFGLCMAAIVVATFLVLALYPGAPKP